MTYIILILLVLTIFLIIRNFKNKSTFFFAIMMFGVEMAIFAAIFMIAKYGQYPYPEQSFYMPDYMLYLKIAKLKINYYALINMLNLGVMIYLGTVPVFVFTYHRAYEERLRKKEVLKLCCVAVLPLLYLWFYSPETAYGIYLKSMELEALGRAESLRQFLRYANLFHYTWIGIYLAVPIIMLLIWCRQSTILLKKMQYLTIAACVLLLNCLCLFLFFTGPFQVFYTMPIEQLLFVSTEKMMIPKFYYTLLPALVFVMAAITVVLLLKFHSVGTINAINQRLLSQNIKKLNKNMRGVFHSFKNTLFAIEVMVKQVRMENPDLKGENIEELESFIEKSLKSMGTMLDACKSINMNLEKQSLYAVLENVLEKAKIPEEIHVEKQYLCREGMVVMDRFHLTNALLNIVNNAVDALNTKNTDCKKINIIVRYEQEWTVLEIEDNGVGMEKKACKNVFKEFYTTKSRQNNWGIGMSYTYRVIRKHLGFITLKSEPMQGTQVQIILPRLKGTSGKAKNGGCNGSD